MRVRPVVGEVYKHFKGKDYKVIAVNVRNSNENDTKTYVIYEALYENHPVFFRTTDEFVSPVDKEKYPDATQEFRFEKVNRVEDEIVWD